LRSCSDVVTWPVNTARIKFTAWSDAEASYVLTLSAKTTDLGLGESALRISSAIILPDLLLASLPVLPLLAVRL